MFGRSQKVKIQRFGWRDVLNLAWVLLVILLFLFTIIYPAFQGRRQPLPAGAYDPRIYPNDQGAPRPTTTLPPAGPTASIRRGTRQ
jgi:hypothetical protein